MLFGCADPNAPKKSEQADTTTTQKIKIGLSMDFVARRTVAEGIGTFSRLRLEKLGAEVIVQSADGDERRQNEQAENMITQGVDVSRCDTEG